jgi:hypothetical protein
MSFRKIVNFHQIGFFNLDSEKFGENFSEAKKVTG